MSYKYLTQHGQDNPWNEVWRSLPLDQTELNIFCKWSRLNQIWENDPHLTWFHPNLSKILSSFVIFDAKGREVIHKDSKIGGANK